MPRYGFTFGVHQLGARVDHTDKDVSLGKWQIEGVPSRWTKDMVLEALDADPDVTDIDIQRCHWRGKVTTWYFRARYDLGHHWPVWVEDCDTTGKHIELSLWCTRESMLPPKNKERDIKVERGRTFVKPKELFDVVPTIVATGDGECTHDSDADSERDDGDLEVGGDSDNSNGPPNLAPATDDEGMHSAVDDTKTSADGDGAGGEDFNLPANFEGQYLRRGT